MTVPAVATTRPVLGASRSADDPAAWPSGARGTRAILGPPIRVDTEPWFPPAPRTGSRRGRGRAIRQALLTAALSGFVLGVPTAATGIAMAELKPATVVSTQQVPGEQDAPAPIAVGFVSAR